MSLFRSPSETHSIGVCLTFTLILLLMTAITGCNMVPQSQLRQAQLRALELHEQNQTITAQYQQAATLAAAETSKNQQLAQQNAGLQAHAASLQNNMASLQTQVSQKDQELADSLAQLQNVQGQLQTAEQRVANFRSTQEELERRMVQLISESKRLPSPLSDEASKRFEELARKYPNFEFDPLTGVSKFHSDILFSSGSAQIKRTAAPLLKEFAEIMNEPTAERLHILIVGHTDDKPIAKAGTRQEHPTNGHLSTNRGHSVRMALKQAGLQDGRMGVAGYGKHQPLVANVDEDNRQVNRRVEIFVLAPDAVVAGWDPINAPSRN
ncbi:OmpA family protein [Thalassoroseus pseudoceratinae]|uniref:OmpA family protein n=1 Tax=Thalassoroseus pseudoceratinae TaxID=2713176 RepID=UPI001423997D|nr:OmpA family protein [Thalassoroseus pseudoceratinae]